MGTDALRVLIAERIDQAGPLPFDQYMAMALYEPGLGYYSAGRTRSDWHGDFITSPQVDPAYGGLWAEGVRELWKCAGEPARFDIVEVGPGEGGFTAALQAELGAQGPFHYTLIEPLPQLADRQRAALRSFPRTTWVPGIEAAPRVEHGVVFANEILDNLPVALVADAPGGPQEMFVDRDGDGLRWVEAPLRPDTRSCMERAELHPGPDGRVEVPVHTEAFVGGLLATLGCGAIILIDYGAAGEDLSGRPGGTLACYSGTGVDDDPLAAPGTKDITAHANWTAVKKAIAGSGATAAGPILQGQVLRSLGAAAFDEALRLKYETAIGAGKGAEGIRALSRRQALSALLAPGGMGSFGVVAGLKGIPLPSFLTA